MVTRTMAITEPREYVPLASDADVLEDTFGSVQGLARALATAGTEALLDVPLERGKMMTIARFFDK